MSAQQEFDNKYISSTEVCQHLGIHRTTVLLALKTGRLPDPVVLRRPRSEEHTSELQSLMRISYAVFCLKKKKHTTHPLIYYQIIHKMLQYKQEAHTHSL